MTCTNPRRRVPSWIDAVYTEFEDDSVIGHFQTRASLILMLATEKEGGL